MRFLKSLFLIILPCFVFGQFDSSIEIDGITFPRMTTLERNALPVQLGKCIYNMDNNLLECYNGTGWTSGLIGAPGMDGIDGQDGAQGAPGMDGVDGQDGASGPPGAPGIDGIDGIDGQDGVPGIDGMDGINCWDTNGNGSNDSNEDTNDDGLFNSLDCQGQIGLFNLPAFRAESTAIFDLVGEASNNIILFNDSWVDQPIPDHSTVFDQDNHFDSATGIFTAPRAGIYWFQSTLNFVGYHFLDDRIRAFISVNGNVTDNCIHGNFTLISGGNTGSWSNDPAYLQRSFGGILMLAEDDQVSLSLMYDDGMHSPGFGTFEMDKKVVLSGYLITDLD